MAIGTDNIEQVNIVKHIKSGLVAGHMETWKQAMSEA